MKSLLKTQDLCEISHGAPFHRNFQESLNASTFHECHNLESTSMLLKVRKNKFFLSHFSRILILRQLSLPHEPDSALFRLNVLEQAIRKSELPADAQTARQIAGRDLRQTHAEEEVLPDLLLDEVRLNRDLHVKDSVVKIRFRVHRGGEKSSGHTCFQRSSTKSGCVALLVHFISRIVFASIMWRTCNTRRCGGTKISPSSGTRTWSLRSQLNFHFKQLLFHIFADGNS